MNQFIFNPVNYGFQFTEDGWYTFDRKAAQKAARFARDQKAKELEKQGKRVSKFSLPNQLIIRGGIGSGRPQIEVVVTCYGLNSN